MASRQPAIVSTHRLNYAHLNPERSAAGRSALRTLLKGLIEDGAVFLIDSEVRPARGARVVVRPAGSRGANLRY